MHINYYFLRQLAPALALNLSGLKLMECFSQDRDELVLAFAQAKGKLNYYRPFYIKASLRPDFSGLFFPEAISRARTNSVDLFTDITQTDTEGNAEGRAVLGVRSFLNERCLAIDLADGYSLLFKFFGNRPNLLIVKDNEVADLFNHKLIGDRQLQIDALDRPIDQSWDAFVGAGFDHRKLFPTFGKVVNAWVKERVSDTDTGEQKWQLIQDTLRLLDRPTYYVLQFEHKPTLSLLPIGAGEARADGGAFQKEFTEPLEAANRFYTSFNGQNVFDREQGELLRVLDKRQKRAESLIDANLQRLLARETGPSHEEIGHILMANLHAIAEVPGQRSPESVVLDDFYREQPIKIKLKTDLSPQKNAENYYRKAKNEKIEEDHLNQQIASREAELTATARHRTTIAEMVSLKLLRKYAKQNNLLTESPAEVAAQLFKEVEHEGFRILIGRNAKNNDLLTQKHAYKDDLWLHARDVSGSHVVIKFQAGKPFPKTVIERAAELAAWYSKRRTDSLCPVMVTPKKFVRKLKGFAEGQVVVDKEDVVMVVPRG
jgi:predicted ribosome quality control (RQC) complex YloA/Tae2 family protein